MSASGFTCSHKNWTGTNRFDFSTELNLMPVKKTISGQVIVGGVDTAILPGIELFPRPTSDACSIPDLPDPAAGHSLSLLSGGRLVVCGVGGSGELCTMGVYSSLLYLKFCKSLRSFFRRQLRAGGLLGKCASKINRFAIMAWGWGKS